MWLFNVIPKIEDRLILSESFVIISNTIVDKCGIRLIGIAAVVVSSLPVNNQVINLLNFMPVFLRVIVDASFNVYSSVYKYQFEMSV